MVKGFVGDVPKTAWVIGYPLLERIHYLLVANFDVFGPVSHQLESRLYMDFLRIEGESNFLTFMPPKVRKELQAYWYRDAPGSVSKYMAYNDTVSARELGIAYESDDPKAEFLLAMKARIHSANEHAWRYSAVAGDRVGTALAELESHSGSHNSYLPQVSYLNVIGKGRDEVYTVLRNSGYANIAQLFGEDERRLPDEDGVTVVRGLLGAYPNYFFQVNENELGTFASAIGNLSSSKDYDRLLERWGVHRTDPWFWRLSDKFHRMLREEDPLNNGLLDYSRYHSR